ncbi:hypothetical protein ACIGBH_42405 [Streptomyces sp. NPDC085929]|uniref:hypothetical protein n=1 Tax=Streptomyces sp. NPDC085929 TaxID=3365739 RepID=UPI0037CDB344
MSFNNRTLARRPLPGRVKCLAGGTIASLSLILAAGVASPVAAAAASMGERGSASSGPGGVLDACKVAQHGGKDNCKRGLTEYIGPQVTVPSGGVAASTAVCPRGQEAISFGYNSTAGIIPGASFRTTTNTPDDSWVVVGVNATASDGIIEASAYCSP